MKIAIFGTGYVGLVTGVCLAELGHNVYCVDIDRTKIDLLNQNISPIHEDGISELLIKNNKAKKLIFTTNHKEAIKKTKVIFIAVGTPEDKDGNVNLSFVYKVAKTIGLNINGYKVIVNKSTVPIGSANKVSKIIKNEISKRQLELNFDVVSNPEFLKEGKAIYDFMNPDRIIIGSSSSKAIKIMTDLYEPLTDHTEKRMLIMDAKSSEMTKYAANSMLATKISFINEIATICEKVGADINNVRLGIGADERIGYKFIYPGVGYGGSCFPKDVKALEKISKNHNYDAILLKAVQKINFQQRDFFCNRVIDRIKKINNKIVSVWGLSFKPGTDDIREAPSIYIIKKLIRKKIHINAHDPIAIDSFSSILTSNEQKYVHFFEDPYDALQNSSLLIILTEWNEYKQLNFKKIHENMIHKIIFDGRNIYNSDLLKNKDIEYNQIGVKD